MTEPIDILDIASHRLWEAQERQRAVGYMQMSEASVRESARADIEVSLCLRELFGVMGLVAELTP